GQLALGRETVARGEAAVRDERLDLADDVFVDPDGLDGLELHQAWPGSPPSPATIPARARRRRARSTARGRRSSRRDRAIAARRDRRSSSLPPRSRAP